MKSQVIAETVAVEVFEGAYGARFPRAAAKITGDMEELPACCDGPAGHRVHLPATNPIESAFATARHRTKVTRGPGSRAAGLAMAFKLIESAQARWPSASASHLTALARAGTVVVSGKPAGRPVQDAA